MYQILWFRERKTRCQKRCIVQQYKVYRESLSGILTPSIVFYGFQSLGLWSRELSGEKYVAFSYKLIVLVTLKWYVYSSNALECGY